MKACKTCGASFVPTGRCHWYCSHACRPSTPPREDASVLPPRACRTCGVVFERRGRAHRFCSVACRPTGAPDYARRKYREAHPVREKAGRADVERRATALALRGTGLTLAAVGREMGISPQRVHQLLSTTPRPETP